MKRLVVSIILCCLALVGCEEVLDSNILPYEELLVINGTVYADSTAHYIQITKTLPLNIPFDTNAAFLKDAVGEVVLNGKSYPLEYIGHNAQYRVTGLVPKVGDVLTLNVSWRGLTARAETTIPQPTLLDSFWYSSERFSELTLLAFKARLKANDGLAVRVGFHSDLTDTARNRSHSRGTPFMLLRSLEGALVEELEHVVPNEFRIDSVYTGIYTFAPGYMEYAITKRNSGEDNFGGEPIPVAWNVEGDAIGGFFGVTKNYYY